MSDVVISVSGVSKSFKLPHEKYSSVKGMFVGMFSGVRTFEKQDVLSNITFDVNEGEFYGIVGRNGSGKSTLLKMLAGIYSPTSGVINVDGKLTPFIELGVGFNMELTGRENVFLNGALLGFSRREMLEMYDEIVEFAELNKFMDQKLKNYSSGMQVRLAFSIAIRAKSDILLIDEVLAVGDASFQQKCFDVFAKLKDAGTTIVLVTHDMSAVLRFCDKAILIEKGKIVSTGKPSKVADAYLELNYEKPKSVLKPKESNKSEPTIIEVMIENSRGEIVTRINPREKVKISIKYENPMEIPTHFGLQIFNQSSVYCFGTNTKVSKIIPITKTEGIITMTVDMSLATGSYYINAATINSTGTKVYNYKVQACDFRITKKDNEEAIALLNYEWHA